MSTDKKVIAPLDEAGTPRWLLMVHQLPSRASNARVKTWRRLQQVGALPTRNAVYVLPNTDACREDFEWIRAEIVALGGEATLFAASTIGADGDAEIVKGFRVAREADYRALIEQAARVRQRRRPSLPRSRRKLRSRPRIPLPRTAIRRVLQVWMKSSSQRNVGARACRMCPSP